MAAHSQLLEALRLSEEDARNLQGHPEDFEDDNDSVSLGSSASISLDGPSTPPTHATRGLSFAPERSSILGLERVQSPSATTDTELASAGTIDSAPATTRTSLSSRVPSISYTEDHSPSYNEAVGQTLRSAVGDHGLPHHDEDGLADAMTSTFTPTSFRPPATTDQARPPSSFTTAPAPAPLHRASTASSTSSLGKKVRPDPLILKDSDGPLILGIALVDFNHSVGPRVEMAHPESLLRDEELCKILPFLALPDGAHQSSEDYSYFHLTLQDTINGASSSSNPETVFGISCNRQIATSDLLEKDADVSRSTVQKAVVVLASKPLFGLIRDRLGVVTSALFNQRDFRDTHILVDFSTNLERSMKSQLTESGLYMGTNLRELIHKFRHRTLTLVKLLMLQKKIMFYGHPVERLCTYQYSLVSLIPNLLLALEDAASPNLDRREKNTAKPTELRTSDRGSLMRYLGLPLNVFGRDAFFQPYLPLQQVDMLKTQSWLCGTTNTIVTQQRDSLPDLLINIELNTFEFNDPKIERIVALTPADRKWMDDIVKDVNEGWNEKDPSRPLTMQFKGSDDYLRAKFEDYVSSALSSVKYADYLLKTGKGDLGVVGSTGDENCVGNFGEAWMGAFRLCHAYNVWNQVTDPALFDIIEPRHPCESKPTIIADVGLRLAEGLYELKVPETIAPAREAITNAISAGSTGFFRAFEGVRSEVAARMARQSSSSSSSASGVQVASPSPPPSSVHHASGRESPSIRSVSPAPSRTSYPPQPATPTSSLSPTAPPPPKGLRPLSLAPAATVATEMGATAGAAAKATISSWGSFIAKKAAEYKKGPIVPPGNTDPTCGAMTGKTDVPTTPPSTSGMRTPSLRSPPLGIRGALWSFGERAEQTKIAEEKEPASSDAASKP